jgi:glutathione peroxidase
MINRRGVLTTMAMSAALPLTTRSVFAQAAMSRMASHSQA